VGGVFCLSGNSNGLRRPRLIPKRLKLNFDANSPLLN
jgi:hypothetical protein